MLVVSDINLKGNSNATVFKAGNIKYFIHEWEKLTNDIHIRNTVSGCSIDLISTPHQSVLPRPLVTSLEETDIINKEIKIMLDKQVIVPCDHEVGEFLSGIFIRPKKDPGKFRVILNLKQFNEFVTPEHFKMDTINTCIELMNRECYMASIDLRDAYYSIPMALEYQKYLKFVWGNQLYKFTCLPMGLACAPRIFVKLLKPVLSHLHAQGYISSGYLDDTYIQGESYLDCKNNVEATLDILTKLGFFVHYEKSVTVPCQKLEHLGFLLNSQNMTVSLTDQKYDKLTHKIDNILKGDKHTIREVASVIGSLVSYATGVQHGSLFYKQLELEKIQALSANQGNFEAKMALSETAINNLIWWKNNALTDPVHIIKKDVAATLCTDASNLGWGATLNNSECGGRWGADEANNHINVLELKAILLGLQSLARDLKGSHILVKSDNTTAVAYVKNMGGCKSPNCNTVAQLIWKFAMDNNIWLSITHIEGILNVEPDALSRLFDDRTEWKLNPIVFKQLNKHYSPGRDLFASRLNKKLAKYVSWQPEPDAYAVDAFSLSWSNDLMYIFAPFSMLTRVLAKLEADQGDAIVIVPLWTAQCWFPKILRLLREPPRMLPRGKRLLRLPFNTDLVHPLCRKMHLLACPLSGKNSKTRDFLVNLRQSSYSHGVQVHGSSIQHIFRNGNNIALDGIQIPILQM